MALVCIGCYLWEEEKNESSIKKGGLPVNIVNTFRRKIIYEDFGLKLFLQKNILKNFLKDLLLNIVIFVSITLNYDDASSSTDSTD